MPSKEKNMAVKPFSTIKGHHLLSRYESIENCQLKFAAMRDAYCRAKRFPALSTVVPGLLHFLKLSFLVIYHVGNSFFK